MVLDDLLESKMTKNQAHISLEISIQAQPLHLTWQKELSKTLLIFMKTPVWVVYHWCDGFLYDICCSAFSVDKWDNVHRANACVQCSAVYTVSAFPLLRPHLLLPIIISFNLHFLAFISSVIPMPLTRAWGSQTMDFYLFYKMSARSLSAVQVYNDPAIVLALP